jgi:hypothetical protein
MTDPAWLIVDSGSGTREYRPEVQRVLRGRMHPALGRADPRVFRVIDPTGGSTT